jgi:hypothetical protein
MFRQRAAWFAVALLFLASLACNAFAGGIEPGATLLPPPTTGVVTTPAPGDGDGLVPTATIPGTVTLEGTVPAGATAIGPTPSGPTATVLVDLNVRSGPGVQYDRVGFLLEGESAAIIGRNPDSSWWKITCPPQAEGAECWISAGSQYSTAVNTGNVPVAAIPPTPTPAAPELPPDTGLLAYAVSSRLFLATLDMNQNPPTAGQPAQLVDSADVQGLLISPDGRRVAYKAGSFSANELRVVNINGEDERTLVASSDLPIAVAEDDTNRAVLIDQVQWLADSRTVAFNTSVVNLVGPGVISQEDLWTATLDGELVERFPAGQGGGAFALSAANQLIMSQAEEVLRANLDGSNPQTVITFDFINTASEYIYYPRPQWTADGSQAYVAIPSPEQFDEEAQATLWRIPVTGAAEELVAIPGNILFNPVLWSPDGDWLAYVQQLIAPSNPPPALVVAEGNGRDRQEYDTAEQLRLYGWNSAGSHFLYSWQNFYTVGQVDEPSTDVPLPGGQLVSDAQWLADSTFIVLTASFDANTWNFISGNLSGANTPLFSVNGSGVQFDVWRP